jgi:hypothetical protein
MEDNLPSLLQAYDRLCSTGEQYPDADRYIIDTGLTFEHPEDGLRPIRIDRRALTATGVVYTNDYHLWSVLHHHGIYTEGSANLLSLLNNLIEDRSSLIWGVAGYTSVIDGVRYDVEGEGITALYDTLIAKGYPPSLVVDGGVRKGCLGLNGVITELRDLPSLGLPPEAGLDNAGIRRRAGICAKTYAQRQIHVGTIPDVLVCVGGGGILANNKPGGTLQECIYAIDNGSVVLLLALRDYGPTSLPGSYQRISKLVEAEVDGRLIVCKNISDIPICIERVFRAVGQTIGFSRGQRQPQFAGLLNM